MAHWHGLRFSVLAIPALWSEDPKWSLGATKMLTLSPGISEYLPALGHFQLWRRFRILPLRLLLHAILLLTSSFLTCWRGTVDSTYLRAMNRTRRHFFFPPDYDIGSGALTYDRIYTADALVQLLDGSLATYYELPVRAATELNLAGALAGHCLTLNESLSAQRLDNAKRPTLSVKRFDGPGMFPTETTTVYVLESGTPITETLGIRHIHPLSASGMQATATQQLDIISTTRGRVHSYREVAEAGPAGRGGWIPPSTPPPSPPLIVFETTFAGIFSEQPNNRTGDGDLMDAVEYFSTVSGMVLSFNLCNCIDLSRAVDDCYYWTLKIHYDMTGGTGAVLHLTNSIGVMKKHQHKTKSLNAHIDTWEGMLKLITVLIAGAYTTLLLRTLCRAVWEYFYARRLHGRLRRRVRWHSAARGGRKLPPGAWKVDSAQSDSAAVGGKANSADFLDCNVDRQSLADHCPSFLTVQGIVFAAHDPSSGATEVTRHGHSHDGFPVLVKLYVDNSREAPPGSGPGSENRGICCDDDNYCVRADNVDPSLLRQAGVRTPRGIERAVLPAVAWCHWNDIPFRVRMRFFSPWLFGSLAAATAMLAIHSFELWSREQRIQTTICDKLLSGLTLLLLWSTFMSHLRATPSLFQVMYTLRDARLFFLAFMCGVCPIFVGFALFGNNAFGFDVTAFSDFSQTCKALFSVLNGDSIFDIYMQLEQRFPPLGDVYLTLFMMLFIYIVLNTLRATIEESFFAARSFRRSLQPFLQRTLEQRSPSRNTTTVAANSVAGTLPGRSLRAARAPEAGAAIWGKRHCDFEQLIVEICGAGDALWRFS